MKAINAPSKATRTTTIDNAILCNAEITSTAFKLYCILVMLAGNENQVRIRIKKLAELLGKSTRTVQADIAILINKGIVERIYRTSPANDKENIASLFIIHDSVRGNREEQN